MDITRKELSTLCNDWADKRQAALDELLESMEKPFIGRTFKQTRVFGSQKKGNQGEYTIEATVTGARHGWEGEIMLVGTFIHPITGKVTETDMHVEDDSYLDD
jgi:hypothetical protein